MANDPGALIRAAQGFFFSFLFFLFFLFRFVRQTDRAVLCNMPAR